MECGMEEESKYFNSHPHEEDDGFKNVVSGANEAFQLTSSRRG